MTWILAGVAGVLVVLVVASLASTKSVRTEHTCSSPKEEVWSVLMDNAAYPDWHPIFVESEGTLAVGEEIVYQLREPSGRQYEIKSKVRRVTPGEELNQVGGLPLMLTYDHQMLLEDLPGGGTRIIQQEHYRGLGVWFWDNSWVEGAYSSVNVALGERTASLQ